MKFRKPSTYVKEHGHNLTARGEIATDVAATMLGAAAVAAVAVGANKVVHTAQHNVQVATNTVEVPPASGEYKHFFVGETFEVDGKQVRITSLDQASQLAHLPDVTSQATLDMLTSQLPEGMQANQIPTTVEFKLPVDAEFGDLHTGE